MGDKNNMLERFSAYVVIPAQVFFDRELPDKARLLYGLISSMCNHSGFCWAKNSTLAKFLGVKEDKSIRNYLSSLKDRGYISVEQSNESGTTIRKIYITALANVADRPVISDRPPGKFVPNRPVNSDRQNNININNIPPIAPQGAGDCESRQIKRRTPTGEVSLTKGQEQTFQIFWEAYPDHRDKQKARQRWKQLNPDDSLVAVILKSIEMLKSTDQWQRGIYPLPSTFLNNRRWEDAEGIAHTPAPSIEQQTMLGGDWLE